MFNMSDLSIALQSAEKSNKYQFKYSNVYLILSFSKSFEVLPKQKGYATISESFALN